MATETRDADKPVQQGDNTGTGTRTSVQQQAENDRKSQPPSAGHTRDDEQDQLTGGESTAAVEKRK